MRIFFQLVEIRSPQCLIVAAVSALMRHLFILFDVTYKVKSLYFWAFFWEPVITQKWWLYSISGYKISAIIIRHNINTQQVQF